MTLDTLMDLVDQEKIYKIVTDLEGPRHPIDNMEALNSAGDYIIKYLTDLGIEVEVHEFYVKGFEEPFKNIVGLIGDSTKPATLIGSHYDTVRFSPGANDNLSGVAVSLEVARLLMKLEQPPTVWIAVFSLEEGHPGVLKYKNELMQEQDLIHGNGIFKSADLLKANKRIGSESRKLRMSGHNHSSAIKALLKDHELSEDEKKIAMIMDDVYEVYHPEKLSESLTIVGSREYMKKVQEEKRIIESVVVYDCLGWIKKGPTTQKKLPLNDAIMPYIEQEGVDMDALIGNFIGVAGDKHSTAHVKKFLSHLKASKLDVPYFGMKLPLDYSQLEKVFPDVLRSDHAPFWAAGIPGVFVSDFANFRSELYHTPADISQYMDFDMLKKVAQGTLCYILGQENR